jgi:hypothetical protein
MGKSMYNFVKRGKEKARQQKQMDKAARNSMAKQQKADLQAGAPSTDSDSDIAEPALVKIVKTTV